MHSNDSKDFKRGRIVQIIHEDDRDSKGMLAIVEEVKSWGVICMVKAPNYPASQLSLTWSMIEDTGGAAMLTAGGAVLREPEKKLMHHP